MNSSHLEYVHYIINIDTKQTRKDICKFIYIISEYTLTSINKTITDSSLENYVLLCNFFYCCFSIAILSQVGQYPPCRNGVLANRHGGNTLSVSHV